MFMGSWGLCSDQDFNNEIMVNLAKPEQNIIFSWKLSSLILLLSDCIHFLFTLKFSGPVGCSELERLDNGAAAAVAIW